MALTKLDDETFRSEIKKRGRILVRFSAPYLVELAEEVDDILEELPSRGHDLLLASLDTDASPRTAAAEEAKFLPTLVLYVDGQAVYRYPDIQDADLHTLADKLDAKLKELAPQPDPSSPKRG